MKITFLYHSAFLVELPECDLLFDWYGGTLPPRAPGKPLYVFASHHHGDHYSPEIFSLGMEHVTYILATCIRLSAKRRAALGIDPERVHRLPANVTAEIGPLTVQTFRSTDAGVAFLVTCGEHRLFHAGDLNWWHWTGEDPAWNQQMERAFTKVCAQLQGISVDAAFLPLDPRLGDAFWWGFDRMMNALEAKMAFPMHCWEDFSVIDRLTARPESREYRGRVAHITENGQTFELP